MNKKIIASLLTLGLVISPVSGAMTESYATEQATEKSDVEKALIKIGIIKDYAKYYQTIKDSNEYRLADEKAKTQYDKAVADASAYAENTEVSLEDLDNHIKNIEDGLANLVSNAGANQKNLKINILVARKLLANNDTKKDLDEYKQVDEKIANAIEILKKDKIGNSDYDKLLKANNELAESYLKAKEKFEDKSIYQNPTDEELSKLDEELNKDGKISINFDKLLEDRQALIDNNESFKITEAYVNASPEKKEAYDKAFTDLNGISDLSESLENYNNISEKLRKLAQARYDIEGKDLGLNTIKVAPSVDDKAKEIEKEIQNLRAYINDIANVNKILNNDKFKDEDLKKAYNETFKKALDVVLGKENLKDLKEYQELSAKLKKLTEDIKGKKITADPAKPTEKTKFDKLMDDLEKALKFELGSEFKAGSEEAQKKLKDAIKVANDLVEKGSSLVTDKEAEDASKAIKEALAGFDNFTDLEKAKKALQALLDMTKAIKIDQIYDTNDQKEAKEAYQKARENAFKLANDKNASLEDMNKAYKEFLASINKLAEFLTGRLQKLVDDDINFRESEKYKAAEKNSDKEEAINNYKKLIEDAQAELKKDGPDANVLNNLYKKLSNARDEINDKMSAQARKLSDAIVESNTFLESEKYKKAAISSDKTIKDAAENYKALIEAAKVLKKAGKLDSKEAKEILDAIKDARDFIEGKISEKKYLSNKYYYILKAVKDYKNGEEYKNLPQALRDKLDKALALYETSSDENAVFSALDAVWQEKEIQAIIKKIELEKNPNTTRDKLLEDLNTLINEDKKLKEGSFKYKKAQKVLRDAYDLALKEARDFIGKNENPSEEEVRAVYKKLLDAKNALDGDKFDELIHALAAKFKTEQMKIANPADRKAIAEKINALSGENMTMDDALRVEKELNALINQKIVATTQTLVPQGQVPTTTRPVSTITNPGSIVKTGINGIGKVAVVLVAALGIFKLLSKKGDKNENN